MHEAHLRDSVALAQTLHWLEAEVCASLLAIIRGVGAQDAFLT